MYNNINTDMDSKLKSLYLRMDADIQTLSDNARAQFIIKSIYTANKNVTKEEIFSIYKNALGIKRVDNNRLETIIDDLSQRGVITVSGKYYSLPRSLSSKMSQDINDSNNRLNTIVDRYFGNSFSEQEIIREWLIDAIITFFLTYSNAWMSDLTSKEKSIESKREDIIQQITNRTNSFKRLDLRDRKNLSKRFFSFITSKDPDVYLFLWEYGTSAFSAQLIKETIGADDLTIDIFKGSSCILDTNVLIDIALEGNEKHESLDVLSEIFKELNMSVYTLGITRNEYINKITSKYRQVKNLMHGSLTRALTRAEDQFMQAAGLRKCSESDDFEIFFDEIGKIPTNICDNINISNYPEDQELQDEMDKYINNESYRNEYQSLYKSMHGYEKRNEPLNHDLGLIGAAQHLCKGQRIFILSDDCTLNQYAKRKPFEMIPIAVRLDTIINVLAVKQGGVLNNQTSFQELFANIVRNGFKPHKDTFQVEDLSYMYDKNIQVASLEPNRIEEIACEINRLRMQEIPDKEISHTLMRYIQGEKIKYQGDYEEMKDKYIVERGENERNKQDLTSAKNKISILAAQNAKHKYISQIVILCFKIIGVFFILVPALFFGGIWLLNYLKGNELANMDFYASLIVTIVTDCLLGYKYLVPTLFKMIFRKSSYIEELINKELQN